MEFILFLSKIDKEIIELVNKANNTIKEDTTLCLMDKRFMGFFIKEEKKIIICTKNAKKIGGYRKKSNNE